MDTIEAAIEALRAGSLILCVDDFDRENEGDFIGAAAHATAAQLALVVRCSTGIVCAPLPARAAAGGGGVAQPGVGAGEDSDRDDA